MFKVGFSNDKYVELQSARIRERVDQFGGKLYLEFGGKLFDDYHASRVLPGFEPDSKISLYALVRDTPLPAYLLKVHEALSLEGSEPLQTTDIISGSGADLDYVRIGQDVTQTAPESHLAHPEKEGFVRTGKLQQSHTSMRVVRLEYGPGLGVETENLLLSEILDRLIVFDTRGVDDDYLPFECFQGELVQLFRSD